MNEVEAKILNINKTKIFSKLKLLGAQKILRTKLKVIWYRKIGWAEGNDEWFLRVRSYNDKKFEVTWKAKSIKLGASRKHKEINFFVDNPEQIGDLFEELDLERYAYQEKERTTWTYKDWKFDLDQYPHMPAYLEIEGKSEKHIQQVIKLLGLEDYVSSAEGERVLIQKTYGLNWYEMRF